MISIVTSVFMTLVIIVHSLTHLQFARSILLEQIENFTALYSNWYHSNWYFPVYVPSRVFGLGYINR